MRLTPRGGADRVEGIARDAEGRAHLAARVSAPPDKGAANAALEKLLAKWLGLPKRDVTLARGHAARMKMLELEGEPQALERALRSALGP